MRRRALLIMATMGLGVLLLGGVALADTIDADLLYAGAGNDTVVGREGNDRIYGNTGSDTLFGNESNDTINSAGDGVKDVVKCGIGKNDTAYVDEIDWVKKNCENVFLRVSNTS